MGTVHCPRVVMQYRVPGMVGASAPGAAACVSVSVCLLPRKLLRAVSPCLLCATTARGILAWHGRHGRARILASAGQTGAPCVVQRVALSGTTNAGAEKTSHG